MFNFSETDAGISTKLDSKQAFTVHKFVFFYLDCPRDGARAGSVDQIRQNSIFDFSPMATNISMKLESKPVLKFFHRFTVLYLDCPKDRT